MRFRLGKKKARIRSQEFVRDPHAFYRQLRAHGGVHFLEDENAWLVISYHTAVAVLRDTSTYSSSPFDDLSPSLHGADPPIHTAMRRLLAPYFNPSRLQLQRDSVLRHTARVLSRLKTLRKFDAVRDLASPIPFSVACEWIGLQEESAMQLHQRVMREVKWADVQPALREDGLLLELQRETDLSTAQLAEFASFFLAASYATSRDLLLLSLWVLKERPHVVQQLTADRSLLPQFTEEVMRLEPSVHTVLRRTRRDTVLETTSIPEGSIVWVSLAAANRDPSVFADPDEFQLTRSPNRHLAFGFGAHACIGSPLGRMENQLVIAELLPWIERMKPAGDADIRFGEGFPGEAPSLRQIVSWPLTLSQS